ncbi:hypothetical protein [Proteiniclasticum ruminis]|nr:hypothetical protein [Proteiniclasticum ruminis]
MKKSIEGGWELKNARNIAENGLEILPKKGGISFLEIVYCC